MNQADILKERDRLAHEFAQSALCANERIVFNYSPQIIHECRPEVAAAFHGHVEGFNAAVKLMLEHREKPLREAIDKRAVNPKCQACEQNFHDDSYTLSVQIPEWSFEKEDV